MTVFLWVLGIAALALLGALLILFQSVFGRKKSHHLESMDLSNSHYGKYRDQLRETITSARALEFQPVTVTSRDGLKLFGRYFDRGGSRAAILVHGYHSNAYNNFSCILQALLDRGYSVLLYDQRAHEESGGRFTTLACKERYDLLRWVDWLSRKEEVEDIFLYGISMGSATVGLASDEIGSPKVKALVMEAGFTSFYDEAGWTLRNTFGKEAARACLTLLAKALLRVDIKESTEEHLARTKLPVLFLHGEEDTDVPAEFTRRNYRACASEKELLLCPGIAHTMCFLAGGEAVQSQVFSFLDRHCGTALCK